MHINVKQFDHAYHALLGNTQKTILGVGAKSHPVLKIVANFFPGDTGWKSTNCSIKGAKSSVVVLRVAKNTGINLGSLKPGALSLRRINGNKKKTVKMTWHPKSSVFSFVGQNTGTFELSYSLDKSYYFTFDLYIVDGTTTIATFDPNNLPFDPEYKPEAGDDSIKPGQIPGNIGDYTTLRRFVLASYPFEARGYKSRKDMRSFVKRIRNTMLQIYSNLIKKNDIDKFGLSEWLTIDWVDGANEEGVLANKLSWTEIKKEEPKDPGGPNVDIEYPSSPPEDVYDIGSLRTFVLWYLRENAFKYYSEKKIPAGMVRDKLASMYPNIERLNDQQERHQYSAGDHMHRDAIYLVGTRQIIDFVTGSSAPGRLLWPTNPNSNGNLTWINQTIAPYGWVW
jgi:hypothetical protein